MQSLLKYLIVFWVTLFILVFFMGATRHVVLNGPRIKGAPEKFISFLSTLGSNIINFQLVAKPMAIPSSFSQKNGFTYSKTYKHSKDYLLVSAWDDKTDQATLKLIRINDGKLLHKWTPNIDFLNKSFNFETTNGIKNSLTKRTTRLLHPLLMNDGSLIFSGGGIYKVDMSSQLVWSNTTSSHHSLEPDQEGNLWICSYNSSTMNSKKFQIMDDAIKKVSSTNGKVIYEKSVFEILMDNGYERGRFFTNPVFTILSKYLDYIHLNEVQPVLGDSRFWKKGDLFLSLRHQNMVLLYRPSTNKIIWSRQGPWIHQHCVTIIDSTRIGIFGNNVIDAQFDNERERLVDGNNVQYIYNFSTNTLSTPYEQFFKSANIGTYTQGRSRILPNGEIFVEESDHGRILYGNYNEEIWSYIERIDKDHISMFNWSRYITEEEFKKFTFLDQKTE